MYRRLRLFAFLILFAAFALGCAAQPTPEAAQPAPSNSGTSAEEGAQPAPTEAPAGESGASDARPIRIGLSTPLTGPSSTVGEGFDMGVTMAIEDLGGEIAGHPIELYKADNKCTPADAVTAVRRLIDEDQVDAIIGSSCSGATLAALPIIQEAGVVQLSVTSSNPTIYDQLGAGGNEWGFRLNLDDLIIARTLAQYIAEEGTKSIFLIGQNNDFGRGAAAAYEEELPKVGIEVAGTEFFDDGTSDFRPILSKIKQSGAEGIMTFMVEHDSAVFFRQKKEVGLDVKVYTRGGVTSPLFLEMTADDPTLAEGAIGASYWTSGLDPETEKRFEERWGTPASVHRMMAYYGMKLVLADAIERAIEANGEVSREGIREALETTDLKGTPLGDISFDEHNQAYPFLTLDTLQDGKITLLETIPGVRR